MRFLHLKLGMILKKKIIEILDLLFSTIFKSSFYAKKKNWEELFSLVQKIHALVLKKLLLLVNAVSVLLVEKLLLIIG
jgi:hypothetical protein